PYPRGIVFRDDEHAPATGTECHVRHVAIGSDRQTGRLARCGVPDLHDLAAPRESVLALGAERGAANAAGMAEHRSTRPGGRRVPEPGVRGLAPRNKDWKHAAEIEQIASPVSGSQRANCAGGVHRDPHRTESRKPRLFADGEHAAAIGAERHALETVRVAEVR